MKHLLKYVLIICLPIMRTAQVQYQVDYNISKCYCHYCKKILLIKVPDKIYNITGASDITTNASKAIAIENTILFLNILQGYEYKEEECTSSLNKTDKHVNYPDEIKKEVKTETHSYTEEETINTVNNETIKQYQELYPQTVSDCLNLVLAAYKKGAK